MHHSQHQRVIHGHGPHHLIQLARPLADRHVADRSRLPQSQRIQNRTLIPPPHHNIRTSPPHFPPLPLEAQLVFSSSLPQVIYYLHRVFQDHFAAKHRELSHLYCSSWRCFFYFQPTSFVFPKAIILHSEERALLFLLLLQKGMYSRSSNSRQREIRSQER